MIPYVWSDAVLAHDPAGEVYVGTLTPGTEVSERALRIRDALDAAGHPRVAAVPAPGAAALHDPEMVAWLRTAAAEWEVAALPSRRVVPYLFPTFVDGPPRTPASVAARAGRWLYDTMTLVGPGTFEAAIAAQHCALTAADLVVAGEPAAYALTRPPGHHAARDRMGGSCYFNHAAAAADALRALGTVAVIDVDAHHGNGTQAIFAADDAVLTGSVHVDPAAGWFPHYLGFAEESGPSNRNHPLAPGTGDAGWLAALDALIAFASPAAGLVVALGVDAAAGDPEAPLTVTAQGYREAGRRLAALGVPTVVVQEGGYDLATLGPLVAAFLAGLSA